MIQNDRNKSRQYICDKLGIETTEKEIRLVLKRPFYATNKKDYDIVNKDDSDKFWKAAGITRAFLALLEKCKVDTSKGPIRPEGYFNKEDKEYPDRYILYLDVSKIQKVFQSITSQDLFRQFDNLKTLEMLEEISMSASLKNGSKANVNQFSDGQFQSVYIYSIIELFKDRNCITLLDEPDSFLHPEWQFEFLKQVFDIVDVNTVNNHVLMCSHSAATIARSNNSILNIFEFHGKNIRVKKVNKAEAIKTLSSGLITFTEMEARLNILHVLKNIDGPILFTEGITDEMILETAWEKLYSGQKRKFEIQNAFDCTFLRNLMKREELYRDHPERLFFSLFDFDVAFNDWNQLGVDVETDPYKCLTKKNPRQEGYALLLPVPQNPDMKKQVINSNTGGHFGNKSLLTIELLFYGTDDALGEYFIVDEERTDGFIKFCKNKVHFAEKIVPSLDAVHFEAFRPIFEFVKQKVNK